jgi:hypothetical protein
MVRNDSGFFIPEKTTIAGLSLKADIKNIFSRKNPPHYRVVIGKHPELSQDGGRVELCSAMELEWGS